MKEEPVGYVDTYDLNREGHDFWVSRQEGKHTVPLYTTPPKREWVGLTKEDVDSWLLLESPTVYEFAKYVEDKLKEKNNE